jgi:hypothetical protein
MKYKEIKILLKLSMSIVFVAKIYCCTGIMAPAPNGIHGTYAVVNPPVYEINGLTKDSMLIAFAKGNLIINSGRLNNYDPPWDSLSYLISNIYCGREKIEAYIEFSNKSDTNTTLKLVHFNALPTKDNEEYKKRVENYYKCFEDLLSTLRIIN